MVERELTEANVGAVLAAPTKQTPGRNGCFNLGGCGPSKKRIRVTGPDTHAHHHRGRCRFEDREMTQPLNVRVDLSARAAYVKYAPGPSASTVDLDASGSVAYDLDAGGTIVGIEILEIQLPGQIAVASEFAAAHGLAFPRDLAGNLVAA
jgi:hypothetical protein